LGLRKACVVARKRKGKYKGSERERSKKEMMKSKLKRRWCEWHGHAIIMFMAKPQ